MRSSAFLLAVKVVPWELINTLHPGRATYVEIPGGNGARFRAVASQLKFMNGQSDAKPHSFETRLLDVISDWLDKQMSTHPGIAGSDHATTSRRQLKAY